MAERLQFSKEVSFGNLLSILTIVTAAVTVSWQVGTINTKADVNTVKIYGADERLTQEIIDRKEDRKETIETLNRMDAKLQTLLYMQSKDPTK